MAIRSTNENEKSVDFGVPPLKTRCAICKRVVAEGKGVNIEGKI